jgi:hypothetical protein
VIGLGALTPVLILVSQTYSISKWIQALPAAIASIVAGLSGTFHPRENWAARAAALEGLESELFKFKTKVSELYAPQVDPQTALDNFVQRVDRINQEELGNWRTLLMNASSSSKEKPASP